MRSCYDTHRRGQYKYRCQTNSRFALGDVGECSVGGPLALYGVDSCPICGSLCAQEHCETQKDRPGTWRDLIYIGVVVACLFPLAMELAGNADVAS